MKPILLDLTAGQLHDATLAVEAIGTVLQGYIQEQRPLEPVVVNGLGAALVIIAQGPLTECREAIEPDAAK